MSLAELEHALQEQERAWNERPLLRALYRDWFRLVASGLSSVPGLAVELGAGIGKLRESAPDVVPTDVAPTRWAGAVVDAEDLPYRDGEVANLVLVDVFHHVARPARFLDEAVRVLARGGRVVILDPYCSPLSTVAYRRFHHERTDLDAEPFEEDRAVADDPLASNQARATLVFFRARDEFERRWPELRIVERRRLALVAYPLSGGFSRRPLVPSALARPLLALERALRTLARLGAFRCFVVLERD
jgi:SAM-dependent methyltransferase